MPLGRTDHDMTDRLEINTVLVPVDGSDESTQAVEYAVAIAGTEDATVHVMYVLGDEAHRALDAGAIPEDEIADQSRSYLDSVTSIGEEAGVAMTDSVAYGFSTRRKLVHPGSVILDCAEQIGADFLVIPREYRDEQTADVLEKAAEYVLLYASQPVLSV